MFNVSEIVTYPNGYIKRGQFVKRDSILDINLYGKSHREMHNSVFLHSEDIIKYYEQNKSLRGYKGECKPSVLLFDIDLEDLSQSLKSTKELIKKLCKTLKYNIKPNQIKVFYSGNRGFHIYVTHPEINTLSSAQDLKEICSVMADGVAGFDEQIYHRMHTIRTINSLHPKTNLFKVFVNLSELNEKIEYIKNIAKNQRGLK